MCKSNLKKNSSNISTQIKRNKSWAGFLWSYTKVDKMTPIKLRYKCKITEIYQIDKITDEIIDFFVNSLDIEEKLKLRKGARNKIYDCIKGKLKTAYGFKWKDKV